MMKRILSLLLIVSLCIGGIIPAAGASEPDIHIYFKDTEIQFDKKPVLNGDTIMCELQGVFDAIGIDYDYNGLTRKITARYKGKYSLEAVMGESIAIADFVDVELDKPFYQDGNKVMMPLESVCYIYNIIIDRSDLSHIVLSEKEVGETYDYAAEVGKVLDGLECEKVDAYGDNKVFFDVATHEKDAGGTVWWTEEQIDVSGQNLPFDTATRIEVKNLPSTFYAYQIKHTVEEEYKAGQTAVISFWAKNNWATNDISATKVNIVWEIIGGSWPKVVQKTINLTNEWNKYYFVGTWHEDLPIKSTQVGVRFCHNLQEFEIADLRMTIYDNGDEPIVFPDPEPTYKGCEDDAIWRKEALKRIEKYRKNDMTINVVDESGNPVKDAKINIDMTRFEFNWGFEATGFTEQAKTIGGREQAGSKMLIENGFNTIVEGYYGKAPEFNEKYVANMMNWAIDNDVAFRFHAYGWDTVGRDQLLPKWASDPIVRGYTDETTMRARHIEQINQMATFVGDFPIEIDVHNEVASYYDRTMDPEYGMGLDELKRFFELARKLNPNSVLVLNEASYGGFAPGTGRTLLFPDLAKYLKEIGCDYDALGMQGHVGLADYPWYWYMDAERLSPYTDYITITEYDKVRETYKIDYAYFRDTLLACYAHPEIKTFIIWSPFYDALTWAPLEVLFTVNDEPIAGWDVWNDLVMGEWWTKEERITNETGSVKIRAHRGNHDIAVTVGDKSAVIPITLSQVDENNVINAVVTNEGITLDSPIRKEEKEKHPYFEASNFGKMTEIYDYPTIESEATPKTHIVGCTNASGESVPLAIDYDKTTQWESKDGFDSLTVELAENIDLKQLEIAWGDGFVKRFMSKIEISEDGESWAVIRNGLNTNTTETVSLNGKKGKYIRVSGVGTKLIVKDLHVFVK